MENDKWYMENSEERLYWLGFSAFPGVGPVKFQRLLTYFGSAKKAWEASLADLKQAKLGETLALAFDDFRRNGFSPVAYSEKLRSQQVAYLTLIDEGYPSLLAKSKQAPFILYVKGNFDFNSHENQQIVPMFG